MSDAGELVDIGVNLTHRRFDRDRDEVIERAIEAGVTTRCNVIERVKEFNAQRLGHGRGCS